MQCSLSRSITFSGTRHGVSLRQRVHEIHDLSALWFGSGVLVLGDQRHPVALEFQWIFAEALLELSLQIGFLVSNAGQTFEVREALRVQIARARECASAQVVWQNRRVAQVYDQRTFQLLANQSLVRQKYLIFGRAAHKVF